MGDFLLVIIELFFARCFRFVTIHAFDRQTDGRTDGPNLDNNTVRMLRSRTVKITVRSAFAPDALLVTATCRVMYSDIVVCLLQCSLYENNAILINPGQ